MRAGSFSEQGSLLPRPLWSRDGWRGGPNGGGRCALPPPVGHHYQRRQPYRQPHGRYQPLGRHQQRYGPQTPRTFSTLDDSSFVTVDDRPFGMAEALADPKAMVPSAAVAAR